MAQEAQVQEHSAGAVHTGHPTPRTYFIVAMILSGITAIEVAIFYATNRRADESRDDPLERFGSERGERLSFGLFDAAIEPSLGLGIDLFARAWTFVAVVVAIRQALDFTTLRAIGTFGFAAVLLWLVVWGVSVAPLPF